MDASLLETFRPFAVLPNRDRRALASVGTIHEIEARRDFVRQGERARSVHVLLGGLTARSRVLTDGTRQIVAFGLPGDSCDLHGFLGRAFDYRVTALAPCVLVEFPRQAITDLIGRSVDFARACLALKIVEEMILREWLVNIASRGALQRIAHLFCEMYSRQTRHGAADAGGFDFPIIQEELGQAVGLSLVHVNRNLQRLKAEHAATWQRQRIIVHDFDKLRQIAGFDPHYLRAPHEMFAAEDAEVRGDGLLA